MPRKEKQWMRQWALDAKRSQSFDLYAVKSVDVEVSTLTPGSFSPPL
jgi:hypothetical protein